MNYHGQVLGINKTIILFPVPHCFSLLWKFGRERTVGRGIAQLCLSAGHFSALNHGI